MAHKKISVSTQSYESLLLIKCELEKIMVKYVSFNDVIEELLKVRENLLKEKIRQPEKKNG